MATKRLDIAGLVDKSMAGRDIAANVVEDEKKPQQQERFKPMPKQAVMVRLDEGDYRILQSIAERKGTKASALIRQAVKEIIRNESLL